MKRVMMLWLLVITLPTFAQRNNLLSLTEEQQGWALLFNGTDFKGWRQCNGAEMPANWEIEDEAMKVLLGSGKTPGEGAGGGGIFYFLKRSTKILN